MYGIVFRISVAMLARTAANMIVNAAMGNATDVSCAHRCIDSPQFVAVHHLPELRCAAPAIMHQQISTTGINHIRQECHRSDAVAICTSNTISNLPRSASHSSCQRVPQSSCSANAASARSARSYTRVHAQSIRSKQYSHNHRSCHARTTKRPSKG